MEVKISIELQEKLDHINWESLQNKYGISKDYVYANPSIASQLAYGQPTDLIPARTEEFSGMLSLRAYPVQDSPEWRVKVITMERQKSKNDTLTLYNHPLSDRVKAALLERTDWTGNDGKTKYGLANANAGEPVKINIDGREQLFLVSIHQPTNTIMGMSVDQVRSHLFDKDGNVRDRGMYGVQFTKEQANALAEGRAVRLDGCRNKEGQVFSCYVQFDAAQRQVVACHPAWLKEAQKTGTDLGLGQEDIARYIPSRYHQRLSGQGHKDNIILFV